MLKILFQTAGVGTRMFVYLAFKMNKRHSELPLINFSTHMKKKCASFALVSDQRKYREHGVSLACMSTRTDKRGSSGDVRTAYLRSNSQVFFQQNVQIKPRSMKTSKTPLYRETARNTEKKFNILP